MPAEQQLSHQAPSSANGASTAHELFALTDEQILEIQPEGEVNVAPGFSPASSSTRAHGNRADHAVIPDESVTAEEPRDRGNAFESSKSLNARQDSSVTALPQNDELHAGRADVTATSHQSAVSSHDAAVPPPWLSAQMKDTWSGEEARELWNGVLQARSEAAAYRSAFATPEDARALKELYPGGANEARVAADRARLLSEIDHAYFGLPGGSADQTSAARADLAQLMLREDPAAFREMVFAGLRALEEAEKGSGTSRNSASLPRLAQIFASNRPEARSAVGATLASPAQNPAYPSTGGANPAPTVAPGPLVANAASGAVAVVRAQHAAPQHGNVTASEAHVASYVAFEKAANEDLERSVGTAIVHTIQQALPNLGKNEGKATVGARQGVPLQERLGAAVRQDVEAALKGDRQLGEQIAQILSARRFDSETRAQVVRLIDDRARQLVPSAARRVINDWTQATLAAHRGKASHSDAVFARREIEPVTAQGPLQRGLPAQQAGAGPTAFSSQAAQTRPGTDPHRNASRSDARRLDYRKLSDEQILDL